jgi:hypothetical protein
VASPPSPPPPDGEPRAELPVAPPPRFVEEETLAAGPLEADAVVAAEETPDRFRTYVAIAIAIVSILGAVVAFTGTLAGQTAAQLDQSGIEDTAQQQQIITDLNAEVDEDVRNLAPYQEDLKAASVLQSQAAALQKSDPTAAANLQAQAESYLVLARTRSQYFQGAIPAPGASGKPVQYNRQAALQRLENDDDQLSELRPDATLQQADAKHSQSTNLVGLVTLFIAALLFLTLAQFTRPAIRRVFAAAGGLTAAVAIALWVAVLVAGS